MTEKRIALSSRPRGCRHVRILGVKPNLDDYDPLSRDLLHRSPSVLYPTGFYAQPLADAGKKVFPSPRQYYYLGDKIRQTALFSLVNVAHPETRLFFGRQSRNINNYFSFPFIAKMPRGLGEGRGVYLIKNQGDLQDYLARTKTAYIQEYLELDRDLRVVVIAGRLAAAYWRLIPIRGFRANLAQGGLIDRRNIPAEGVDFALDTARRCGFDDVGLDVCRHKNRWLVLEANMHYGLKGVAAAGVSLPDFLDRLIEEGVI